MIAGREPRRHGGSGGGRPRARWWPRSTQVIRWCGQAWCSRASSRSTAKTRGA